MNFPIPDAIPALPALKGPSRSGGSPALSSTMEVGKLRQGRCVAGADAVMTSAHLFNWNAQSLSNRDVSTGRGHGGRRAAGQPICKFTGPADGEGHQSRGSRNPRILIIGSGGSPTLSRRPTSTAEIMTNRPATAKTLAQSPRESRGAGEVQDRCESTSPQFQARAI